MKKSAGIQRDMLRWSGKFRDKHLNNFDLNSISREIKGAMDGTKNLTISA
jgi:hypothetical protein